MVLVPIMFRDNFVEDVLRSQSKMLEKHFFGDVFPSDFLMTIDQLPTMRRCDRRTQQSPDGFQVRLDVQQFAPEEISVKMTGDNYITVEGKHEEKQDEHGFISRHFVRKYRLPEGHDSEKVMSSLSADGVLTIKAPKLALPEPKEAERTIPVIQTGKPLKEIQAKDAKAQEEKEVEKK